MGSCSDTGEIVRPAIKAWLLPFRAAAFNAAPSQLTKRKELKRAKEFYRQ